MSKNKILYIFHLFSILLLSGCGSAIKSTSPSVMTNTESEPTITVTIPILTPIPTNTIWPTMVFPTQPSFRPDVPIKEIEPVLCQWTTYKAVGQVEDIAFGSDGSVWFANRPGGLQKFINGEWSTFDPGKKYDLRKVAVTKNGQVYVIADSEKKKGSDYNLIVGRFDGKNWTWWPDISVAMISDFVITPDNRLWISYDSGVYEFNGKTWKYNDMGYMPTAFSRQNVMWSDGYLFMKNGNWVNVPYSSKTLVPDDQGGVNGLSGRMVFMDFGLDDSMWYRIIYYGFIHVYNDGKFDFYNSKEYSQPFSTLNGLVAEDGVFWFSGFEGIFNFDGENWNHINYGDTIVFSMKKSPTGNIWFGGVGEIYHFHPCK